MCPLPPGEHPEYQLTVLTYRRCLIIQNACPVELRWVDDTELLGIEKILATATTCVAVLRRYEIATENGVRRGQGKVIKSFHGIWICKSSL